MGLKSRFTIPAGLAGISAALLLALGLIAGVLVAGQLGSAVPDDSRAVGPATSPVSLELFDDPAQATLRADNVRATSLRSNADGTLSEFSCAAGLSLESGDVIASVNGEPQIVLHTSMPLWRNLAVNDTGKDVGALRAELTRLGSGVGEGARVDRAVRAAIRQFFIDRNVSFGNANSVVSLTNIVWIPAPVVSIASCTAGVGDRLTAGAELLTLDPLVSSLSVSSPQAQAVEGERMFELDGVTVVVDSDGRVTDPAVIAALMATSSARRWISSDTAIDGLSVVWRLADPLVVASVPPSSLAQVDGRSACLLVPEGNSIRVTIVSSLLGRALVNAAEPGGELPDVVLLNSGGTSACN